MTKPKKATFEQNARIIDERLKGLTQALGDVFAQGFDVLKDKSQTEMKSDHTFETKAGTIIAHAGVHLHLGDLHAATADQSGFGSPNKSSLSQPAEISAKPLTYDLSDRANSWMLVIALAGVNSEDLNITQDGTCLVITADGARQYAGRIEFGAPFSLDGVTLEMRDGLLTLEIRKGIEE
ncbi:Hsp20/alpha crystallin family protein [Yoonia sp.]|uniref:Hsp20/alpha crystallin family protein n=1 Tax=Yoonia sp. TaxID=2212373 RepID=UPI00358F9E11